MQSVRIEAITAADVTECTQLCVDAVAPDPFATFLERYSAESFYDGTFKRLSDAVDPTDETNFAFKAVMDVDEIGGTRAKIVGVSHWYVGYVVIPKVDPFAKKIIDEGHEIGVAEVALGDGNDILSVHSGPTGKVKRDHAVMDELVRQTGNLYVGNIRGKKHVYLRRMMVHPDHQRQGIGRKLLQWGLDQADRERLVAWLNGRPSGLKLYLDAGFEIMGPIEARVAEGDDDLNVPPGFAMLRKPREYKGN